MTIEVKRTKYYKIISGYDGKVIGLTTNEDMDNVRKHEPKAIFETISKKSFMQGVNDD